MPFQDRRRVRTVEEAHLARTVWLHVGSINHVHARLLQRELALEVKARVCRRLRHFNHEEVERFAANEHIVAFAQLFGVTGCGFLVRSSGNDAVHERGAEHALLLNPFGKGGVAPVGYVLQHALLQRITVVLDQLARNENESRKPRLHAGLQDQRDLARECIRVFFVFDAGLSRVGHDETDRRRAPHDVLHGSPVALRVQDALDGVDFLDLLDLVPVNETAQARMVRASAGVDDFGWRRELVADWLHDLDESVKAGGVVHPLHHPVDEAAEEVSLAELENL